MEASIRIKGFFTINFYNSKTAFLFFIIPWRIEIELAYPGLHNLDSDQNRIATLLQQSFILILFKFNLFFSIKSAWADQ